MAGDDIGLQASCLEQTISLADENIPQINVIVTLACHSVLYCLIVL